MQIKSYNRAVDPNTIHGNVQAPSDANAYGANVSGEKVWQTGLQAVQQQMQAYVDDQINLSVIDAKNKYEQGMNDLLNNPDTGLLNMQDVNALDVVNKYQEGEKKIREDAMAGLPNYRKAQDTFLKMANDVNVSRAGQVMKYQYAKDLEHRDNTFNTFVTNETDHLVETNDSDGIFKGLNRIAATAYAVYGNIYGKDKMDALIKDKSTTMVNSVLTNLTASGNASDFDKATALLEKVSPWVDDSKLDSMRHMLLQRKHDNGLIERAKEAARLYPNDPKKRAEYIRQGATKTVYSGSASTGNPTVDMYIDAAHEQGIDPRIYLSTGMRETGGDTIEGMHMADGGGFAQITDETAQAYDLDNKFPGWNTDAKQNIRAGAYVLKKKIEENGGDEWEGVRAYNGSGEAAENYRALVKKNYDSLEGMDLSGNGGSKIQPYNLLTQGANIDEQVQQLKPEFREALPIIGGMLNQMGVADGAEISSGGRTREHNAEVGGSPTSQHIIGPNGGDAVDIVLPDGTTAEKAEEVRKAFEDSGAFDQVLFHDAGSGYHLHLGGYHGGLEKSQGVTAHTEVIYDEQELQKAESMATSLVAEQKRQEKEVNDAIVEKGRMEMQQLYQSGNLDPQAYLNIASKYGNDNPDVYAALKSCISTYVSIRTGGSSGGGGGGGRGGSGGSRVGAGGANITVLKSLFGTGGIESFTDIVNYCNNHGIYLSQSNLNTLQKAASDYQNGTGEYKPMYNITPQQIADASGIDPKTFKGNWAVVQQLVREAAVKYRAEHNGQEPPLNELIQFGVNAVTADANGYSQAQMRAAGILRVTVGDNGYAWVTDLYHNSYYIDVWDVQAILKDEKTLADVVEAADNSSGDDSSSDDSGDDDGSTIDKLSNAASEIGKDISEAAEAINESFKEHAENNVAYVNGETEDQSEGGGSYVY
ncbi:D-Ala-D-Ala carboxypeptidase family metallohydrolase [Megasphaera elsdenii]|uniref:D-Ala-D-Ala carboxypeptidase family metallohydrolase n=1 Tax=Megasphaera elsdenii TaxID=907 RepID=UPI002A801088|nr:D-Ala-D-Ala carboxypeptidase family metallohydrolase [Megasphaera elsdenii]MCI7199483.1 D-Ala-D-Ala carboxypeptidase family metallohydrolase [Megasphaera elsdenii]MDY4265651.1 D-Ala-D-Ala carboxypeptidase family metallohydrolase [Megasphaera elsdenii]